MTSIQSTRTVVSAPLVSVLLPCYNHEDFIEASLASIASNTYTSIEIILIDDGSRDRSFEKAQEWMLAHEDRFVRAIAIRQENAGLPKTLNRLVREARGAFLAFLASDDEFLPNSIESRVAYLQANSDRMAVYGDSHLIDRAGNVICGSLVFEHGVKAHRRALLSKTTLPLELVLRWSGCGPGLMTRREIFGNEHLGPWREDLAVEDREFFLRMAAAGVLGFIPTPVARYRVLANSFSNDASKAEMVFANIRKSEEIHIRSFKGLSRLALALRVAKHRTVRFSARWFIARLLFVLLTPPIEAVHQ